MPTSCAGSIAITYVKQDETPEGITSIVHKY